MHANINPHSGTNPICQSGRVVEHDGEQGTHPRTLVCELDQDVYRWKRDRNRFAGAMGSFKLPLISYHWPEK